MQESGIWFNIGKLYSSCIGTTFVGWTRASRIVRKIYLDAGKKSDLSTRAKKKKIE